MPYIQEIQNSGLDWNSKTNASEIYSELNKLRIKLENTFDSVKNVKRDLSDINNPEY